MPSYDKSTKNMINGAAWLALSAIILKVIGLIYKIPISYLLGDEGMGYFNSAYTVYTFFYVLGSAGIPKAVSILSAKSSPEKAKGIFLFIFKIYIILGMILSLLLFILSKTLAESIGSGRSYYSILAITPSIIFVCASGVLRGYLNGKMRFAPVAISELIGGVGKLFLGLFLANLAIRRGLPLPIVCAYSILGVTLGAFFGFIYLFLYYKKESKYVKREYTDKREVLKSVLKIGIPIAFATALSSLVGVIDLSIIMNTLRKNGYSESVSTVIYGNYTTLAVPMLTAVTGLLNMISLAALPTIAKCHSERRKTDLSSSIRSSLDLSMLLAIPSSFAFFLFPYEILAFLFEIGSATLGAAFLSCLAPAVFFYSLLTSLNTALEGMNKINSAMISLILGAIIKLLSSFILIRTDSIGALGAPLGTTLSYAFSFLFSLICIRREKSVNIRLFSSLKAPVITSLIASVGAIFIKLFIYQKNIDVRLKSLFILSAFGIFYFVFCLFITIKPKKHAITSSN